MWSHARNCKSSLWPVDTYVDFEHSLNAAIKRLRAALGDSADAPRYVETLPRQGYRFVAPLSAQAALQPPEGRAVAGVPQADAGNERSAEWRLVLLLTAVGVALVMIASLWLRRTEYFWRNPYGQKSHAASRW
jgi:Transcriptional regulatory protein, C terminal